MSKLYIKAPDGRIVDAPAAVVVVAKVDGVDVRQIDAAKLKGGWLVATAADVAKLAKANEAADFERLLAEEAAKPENVMAAAIKRALAEPTITAAPASAPKEP